MILGNISWMIFNGRKILRVFDAFDFSLIEYKIYLERTRTLKTNSKIQLSCGKDILMIVAEYLLDEKILHRFLKH